MFHNRFGQISSGIFISIPFIYHRSFVKLGHVRELDALITLSICVHS